MVAGFVVVLALGSLTACAKINFLSLGKQETVLLQLRTDKTTGACMLEQKTPPEIRASGGSVVRWMFVGECQGGPTVGIRSTLMTRDGRPIDAFDSSFPEMKLEDTVRATPGPPVTLRARVRSDLERDHYKYQVLINGKPAEYNSEADEGSFFVCPRWPCSGGFKDY
jgi:hypothetical protein